MVTMGCLSGRMATLVCFIGNVYCAGPPFETMGEDAYHNSESGSRELQRIFPGGSSGSHIALLLTILVKTLAGPTFSCAKDCLLNHPIEDHVYSQIDNDINGWLSKHAITHPVPPEPPQESKPYCRGTV